MTAFLVSKKFKVLVSIVLLLTYLKSNSQVGIGTKNPHFSSVLELQSIKKGFLPPRMTKIQLDSIENPATGLLVFCLNCSSSGGGCLEQNIGTPASPYWECIGASSSPSVIANCTGFQGSYYNGIASSGDSFKVTVTNNSFSSVTISFASSDLVLSGISGLSVGTPIGQPSLNNGSATLVAGGSVVLSYPITGTPGAKGQLRGVWTKLSLTCSKTVTVTNQPPTINCNDVVVNPNNFQLINGNTYSGSITIPYTTPVSGEAYPSQTIISNGLTFTRNSGVFALSGSLIYNVTGTYTGANNNTYTITTDSNAGSCIVTIWDAIRGALALGGCASCSKYDTTSVNKWISITASEYQQLALLSGSGKYVATDSFMNLTPSVTWGVNGSNFTVSQDNSFSKVPPNNFIYAFQIKSGNLFNTYSGVKLKKSSTSITIGYSDVGGFTPSFTTTGNFQRVFFVLKRPSIGRTGSNSEFIALFLNGFNYGSMAGNSWQATGDSNNLSGADATKGFIQILSTNFKQW
jgi:hypothetical protein